jgi:hypothetical protein
MIQLGQGAFQGRGETFPARRQFLGASALSSCSRRARLPAVVISLVMAKTGVFHGAYQLRAETLVPVPVSTLGPPQACTHMHQVAYCQGESEGHRIKCWRCLPLGPPCLSADANCQPWSGLDRGSS